MDISASYSGPTRGRERGLAKVSHDQVDRQKTTIEALAAIGADTADAERILKILEESQNTHLAEMMKALNALDDMPTDGSESA